MNLKSMKLTKKESKEMLPIASTEADRPQYPYGLQIRLDHDTLEKLGIKKLPASGTAMMLIAKCDVVTAIDADREGKKSKTMEIQITDMCLESGEKKDLAKEIYGKEEKE